jgi:SAM-dependent MidA family methyltransferase
VWWSELGEPSIFEVVECGGADGALAAAINDLDLHCREALRYSVVERSTAARERLKVRRIPHSAALPEQPITGVVFANELLDNIPVSIFEYRGNAWWEVCYDERTGSETLREVLLATAERLDVLVESPTSGMRVPLQTEARGWVADAIDAVAVGRVVCIDYARTTAEMAVLEQQEWLRTYRNQLPGMSPFQEPGSQDITCDVAIDQMPAAALSTQAEFLHRFGIEAFRSEAKRTWEAEVVAGGLKALQARAVLSEIEALVDPAGLGGFTVFEWVVPEQ